MRDEWVRTIPERDQWLTDDQWLVETWFDIEMEVVRVRWYDRHDMGNTL